MERQSTYPYPVIRVVHGWLEVFYFDASGNLRQAYSFDGGLRWYDENEHADILHNLMQEYTEWSLFEEQVQRQYEHYVDTKMRKFRYVKPLVSLVTKLLRRKL
jgi:hypothetical protein